MSTRSINDAAAEFLAKKRPRERGYEVFAVNPNASEVEGDLSVESLDSIPGGLDVWMHRDSGRPPTSVTG